jgi:3-deoxy-D-manno-octulosonate 8-phosphate phosphatase (KDO 8-P phosphatase)
MIKLIVLDVDGTLTDGKITYDSLGNEYKSFDVKDGLAVAAWTKQFGLKAAIITGRQSSIVEKRACELGISHLYQKCHNKDEVLENILKEENLTWKNVAAIGDDINDLKMLQRAHLSFCPCDAVETVQKTVKKICTKSGGNGAVREMVEYILKLQGNEEKLQAIWQ